MCHRPNPDWEKCSALSEYKQTLGRLFYDKEMRSCDQIVIWVAESETLEMLRSQDDLRLADVIDICTGCKQMEEWRSSSLIWTVESETLEKLQLQDDLQLADAMDICRIREQMAGLSNFDSATKRKSAR